jgi:CheY-like chemotaxis protein
MPRILVVDDDDAVRGVLKLMLSRAGYQVSTAANGLEALVQIKSQPTDLVLLDIEMPGMNGLVFCKKIQADPLLCSTPVIMMTGRPIHGVPEQVNDAGAIELIHKPFERLSLLEKVKKRLT